MAKKSKKGPKSLWDKVHDVDPDFAVAANSMTEEQLRNAIVEMANDDERILAAKKEDMDLIHAREELAECNKTYSIPLNRSKLKKQLALETLQGRGKLAS